MGRRKTLGADCDLTSAAHAFCKTRQQRSRECMRRNSQNLPLLALQDQVTRHFLNLFGSQWAGGGIAESWEVFFMLAYVYSWLVE